VRVFENFSELKHSYAVAAEVGKVGVESSTFIEPVQKRKDGIEAMFMRQTKAKESAKAAGTGKRKYEPSSSSSSPSPAEVKEETRTGTTPVPVTVASPTSPSPAKRVKTDKKKRDPIEPMEIVDVDVDVDAGEPAEDNKSGSDIEILSSPGPSSSQPVLYRPPLPLQFLSFSRSNTKICFPQRPQSQKRGRTSETTHLCRRVRSSNSPLLPKRLPRTTSPTCVRFPPTHHFRFFFFFFFFGF